MDNGIFVLHSGGLDSTACLLKAIQEVGKEKVEAVGFQYGQKHSYEIAVAHNIARKLGVSSRLIDLPESLFASTTSSLVNKNIALPDATYEELKHTKGQSPTYVPFRNGIFLSLVSAVALQSGKENTIFYGAHSEDARNWAYPDCTPEFNGSMASAIYIGTYHQVRLVTPLQFMSKADVVREYIKYNNLEIAYSTWSCYRGPEETGLHCGTCPTCRARKEAFFQAGVRDFTHYEVEGLS